MKTSTKLLAGTPIMKKLSATLTLTDRQRRERDFYEERVRDLAPRDISFAPVLGKENRPWNPSWFIYGKARELYAAGARNLLDVGCGPGVSAVRFAKIGFDVSGVDVSPASVSLAQQNALRHGFNGQIRFTTGVVEQLGFDDETFDVIAGFDILHHIEVHPAITECLRVLKPGGVALFKEWIEVPLIDGLRRMPPLGWMFPSGRSIRREITEDERKLTSEDLWAIRAACPDMTVHRFRVLARLHRLLALPKGVSSPFEMADAFLIRTIPFFRRLGGAAVLVLKK